MMSGKMGNNRRKRGSGPLSSFILSILDALEIGKSSAYMQPKPSAKKKAPTPPAKTSKPARPNGKKASHASAKHAEIVMPGKEERKQTIPPRNGAKRQTAASYKEGASASGASSTNQFFIDMKNYAERGGAKAPFVPFSAYWPTYDSMNGQQTAWYFYWRSEVRDGRTPDTDLSYLLIHIYELLSGCGWKEPSDGLRQLNGLWMAYRERFPQLDGYMFGWTFDFARLYSLGYTLPDRAEIRLPDSAVLKNLLIDQHSGEKPVKLSFALIDALCDYSMTDSKFYKNGHQLLMREAMPRVVALADAALLKKQGRGLLEAYGPKRATQQSYSAFQNAVCPNADKPTTVSVKAYVTSRELRGYINELVRFGENVLRSLYGDRGRLKGVTLDEETAALVEAFVKKEYAPDHSPKEKPNPRNGVRLDFESIDTLRAQSDAVREALKVPEEREDKKPPAEEPGEGSHFSLESEALQTAEILPDGAQDGERAEVRGHSVEESGCFDLSRLPEGLKQLAAEMTPLQQETLRIILVGDGIAAKLGRLAEDAMTMPELLVDELNDAAACCLDDILIDAPDGEPCVLEQYAPALREALKK